MRMLDSDTKVVLVEDDKPLGSGGRGSVYKTVCNTVESADGRTYNVACKLVADGYRTPGREAKIDCLAKIGKTSRICAAWPIEKVRDDGKWVGYTMRLLNGMTLDEYVARPSTTLLEKVKLAARACRLVSDMHGIGIVVGDVSMANFMYDHASDELGLIDLDSVQVIDREHGAVYPAAESFERSPEMAGKVLGETTLTSRSDDFLVAVMAFLMLFDMHPLDSFESDRSSSEIREENARKRRFPYRKLSGVLPVDAYGAELGELFGRTFEGPYESIPAASEFGQALEAAAKTGVTTCPQCSEDYLRAAGSCPRCKGQRGGEGGSMRTGFVALVVVCIAAAYVSGADVGSLVRLRSVLSLRKLGSTPTPRSIDTRSAEV